MSANVLWQRLLAFFPELVFGNSGAAPAINWAGGSTQSLTLNAATVTPTFAPPPAGADLKLVLTQDGVGGRLVAWPGAVSWIGGAPPVLQSGAGQTSIVAFYYDGATYWGWNDTAGSPSSALPWTDVAAGTALAASLARPNLSCDSSGAQTTVTLPTAAALAASVSPQFTVKATGNMLSPVVVTAGAGTTIELLNAPGTFGASTWLPIQGQSVVFKYDLATTSWKVAAASMGSGAPGTAAYNPQWFGFTTVYLDPEAGSDDNAGNVIGEPVQTMKEVIRRYGSPEPAMPFGQNLTINQLSAQALNVDAFYFNPKMSGGGNFAWIATNPDRGAAFSPTTVTAKVQSSAGNALALNGNLPAGLAVGDIVTNTTKNSIAKVQAIGGGNATMSQPFAAAQLTTVNSFPFLVEDDTWANTDTYQATIPLLCNLKNQETDGGDATNPGGVVSTAWFQGIEIADSSGTPGASALLAMARGGALMFSLCTVDPNILLDNDDGFSAQLLSCGCTTASLFNTSSMQGGYAANVSMRGSLCFLDGDVIVKTTCNVFGSDQQIGSVQLLSTATMLMQPGSTAKIIANTANALLWGPGKVNLRASTLLNASGGTWANCLKVATLQIEGATTAWSPQAEGTFTLNGVTQVDVAGVNGTNAFPANAGIAWGLTTVGSTPGVGSPYFSAAQAANAFHVKSLTAAANDVYHWVALAASGVTLSAANLDIYQTLFNLRTGARYAFQ